MQYKKQIILSILTTFLLLALIIGATFAYFQAQTGEGAQTDIKINASTVDTLTFETGSAISLSMNQDNFASGKGNQSGTTFAKAMLSANNKTNTATKHYYLYLNISNNTFTYSLDNNTPEILLSIKDGSNNEITTLTGLTYKTVTDGSGVTLKGFDITSKRGLITLLNNKEITANPQKTDTWNITVTFVNYNSNQAGNAGKSFDAKLMIQKEKIKETVATVCSNGQTLSSCIVAMDGKDDTLYHHTSTLTNGAADNSYRYAGASEIVNNFVCFGSSETPCPTDNLYRIIGVIDGKVKLIKYDYANSNLLGTNGDYYASETPNSKYKGNLTSITTCYWNYKASNSLSSTWSTSLLNKINLNTNFINNIGSTWASKITITTWKVGGNIDENIAKSKPSVAYKNEIVAPAENTTYDAKIGLMYVSDYGFAASPSAWSTALGNYSNVTANNWMYMGNKEWTISHDTDFPTAFFVINDGCVGNTHVNSRFSVRPSFNLSSSITYVSGSGSMSDPIRVN